MKDSILVRLYHGNLEPMGNVFKEMQRHQAELLSAEEAEKKLKSTINQEQNRLYDELNAAQSDINTIIEDVAFAEGFKLAMQLTMVTHCENDDSLIKKWSSFFMEGNQNAQKT